MRMLNNISSNFSETGKEKKELTLIIFTLNIFVILVHVYNVIYAFYAKIKLNYTN